MGKTVKSLRALENRKRGLWGAQKGRARTGRSWSANRDFLKTDHGKKRREAKEGISGSCMKYNSVRNPK